MTKTIPSLNYFLARRNRLVKSIQDTSGTGVVVIGSAREVSRNRDSEFPYRQDSDFYYLTGFDEPQSFLVIQVNSDQTSHHLFCRPKNLEREIWDGVRLGPEVATEYLGIDFAYSIDDLDQKMPDLLTGHTRLYYKTSTNAEIDDKMRQWIHVLDSKARLGIKKPTEFFDLDQLIHEQRLFKDELEILLMRKAAMIAAKGHLKAMSTSQPGLQEYHLEAELLYEFRKNGSQSVAYNSIVAAGENACILHYRAGNAILHDGDLCLIDAGCELDSYASDITRTFPVNGKFSHAQKQVYEIVLAAQEAAIQQCHVGKNFQDPHDQALLILTQGLFDLHVLNHNVHGSLADAIEKGAYKPYYMHRTSHWLGMDVHDVGSYREPLDANNGWRILQPGMVLTIEPGLYFRPTPEVPEQFWNIGIRIEDDVLIQTNGPEILSRDVPVGIAEIEHWMAHGVPLK
jgi:Xaa-Pro aminopeptidase